VPGTPVRFLHLSGKRLQMVLAGLNLCNHAPHGFRNGAHGFFRILSGQFHDVAGITTHLPS